MRRSMTVAGGAITLLAPIALIPLAADGAAAGPEPIPRLWTVTVVAERAAARPTRSSTGRPAAARQPVSGRAPRAAPVARPVAREAPAAPRTVTVTVTTAPPVAPTPTTTPAPQPTTAAPATTAPVAVPTAQAPPSPTMTTMTIRHVSLDGASTSDELVPVTVTAR